MCLSIFFSAYAVYRGVTIFKVDPFTCSVIESRTFDTWASASDATALANYMNNAAMGDVLVGVTFDEPTDKLDNALYALNDFGVPVSDVGEHGSFAFVGLKGYSSQTALAKAPDDDDLNARVEVVIRGTYFDSHNLVLLPAL
jgi:hypothetical protein